MQKDIATTKLRGVMQSRWPIPVVVWSEASVGDRSIAGNASSNPVEYMDVCCLRKGPLRQADHSCREVIQRVCVCLYLTVGDVEI